MEKNRNAFFLLDRFEQDEKMSHAAKILGGRDEAITLDDLYLNCGQVTEQLLKVSGLIIYDKNTEGPLNELNNSV